MKGRDKGQGERGLQQVVEFSEGAGVANRMVGEESEDEKEDIVEL